MAEQEISSQTFNKWLRVLSPCVIAIVFCLLVMLVSLFSIEKSGGWSFLGAIIFFPVLLVLLFLDFIVKLIFKTRTFYIWLIELALIITGVFIFLKWIYD
ncbi:MAG: hypothetical protein V4722_05840 [Bacteroidota bacterium]